jgi:hypothetical protein
MLVVAGPHRLRLVSGSASGPTVMGWGGASLTPDSVSE